MRYLASLFALFALAFTLALAEPIPRAAPGAAAGELVGRRERMFGRPAGVLERDEPKRGQAGGRAGGISADDSADATTNYVSLLSSCAATSATWAFVSAIAMKAFWSVGGRRMGRNGASLGV